mgnify:CR=1 FL=1
MPEMSSDALGATNASRGKWEELRDNTAFPEGKPYRPGASRTGANVRTWGKRSALSIAQSARREMIQYENPDPKHNQIPTN